MPRLPPGPPAKRPPGQGGNALKRLEQFEQDRKAPPSPSPASGEPVAPSPAPRKRRRTPK